MRVKVRSIHAGEFGLVSYQHPAGTTHAGTINHDRIQAHNCLDPRGSGGLCHLVHHKGAADGNHTVKALSGCQQLLNHTRIAILLADRAIVGGNHYLIADSFQAVEPVEQEFAASLDEGDDPIALSLQSPGDGVDTANAIATARAQYGAPAI